MIDPDGDAKEGSNLFRLAMRRAEAMMVGPCASDEFISRC